MRSTNCDVGPVLPVLPCRTAATVAGQCQFAYAPTQRSLDLFGTVYFSKSRICQVCSAQAAALLEQGKQKYDNGDKMGALKLFDQCLKQARREQGTATAFFTSVCLV